MRVAKSYLVPVYILLLFSRYYGNEGAAPEPEPEIEPETEPEAEVAAESGSEVEPEKESANEPVQEPETTAEPEDEAGEAENENSGPEPEAETTSLPEVCLFVTLFSICIVLIVVGNVIVSVVIIRDKTLRKNTSNLFLVSLVAARASIGVFVVPARITGMFSEAYLGSTLCKLCHFVALGSSAASVFSIVAVALTKYRSVMQGELAKDMTMRTSGIILGVIWVLGFVYAVRAPIMNDLNYITIPTSGKRMWSCVVTPAYKHINNYFIFVDLVWLFLIPLVIIFTCYSKVIKRLAENMKVAGKNTSESVNKQSRRAIQMLVILMTLFTICSLAPMILKLYVNWLGGYFDRINTVQAAVYLFSYSNSWFNLIVFAIFRQDLRDGFMRMWRGSCQRHRKVKPCDSTTEVKKIKPEDLEDSPKNNEAMMMMEF